VQHFFQLFFKIKPPSFQKNKIATQREGPFKNKNKIKIKIKNISFFYLGPGHALSLIPHPSSLIPHAHHTTKPQHKHMMKRTRLELLHFNISIFVNIRNGSKGLLTIYSFKRI
jgi:hypothetical protein